MTTSQVFVAFVVLVALSRLAELRLSRRNEARLRKLGAREHAPEHFIAMQLLHTFWLVSIILEVTLLRAPFQLWVSVFAAVCFAFGLCLRYAAIHALGGRWTVRVLTLPGAAPVAHGIYRYLRHPNYLGVVLEIAALPMMHSAWRSALVFSLANAVLLIVRIREEERALRGNGGYDAAFAALPRLWPSFRTRGAA
ncbi:MAG TPA: isoprenylcysteine carboxylmethyltransferase family protein [Polyangiaceae bacterium]|nr:isoprenylcysteine carboxylmethyltransferase family protein [Polyangiaceae bacterium]